MKYNEITMDMIANFFGEEEVMNHIDEDAARNGMVRNLNGTYVYFDQVVNLMDEELLEELHFEIAGCTKQQFFTLYEVEHITKFGEEWELSKVNPVY